ncbi:hypothetical protein A9Q96_09070 [Rhodobacterales bacterium 52_120_T64]|nr:hypothetical protein A9Q96_09070 [Rhodobacterales bacterium 52_120_T64]
MFFRFRISKNVGAIALTFIVSSFGSSTAGQSNSGEIGPPNFHGAMTPEFFRENILIFMAACDGQPGVIPLTEASPYLLRARQFSSSDNYQQVAWLEPNCGFLFADVKDTTVDILPSDMGFSYSVVSPVYLSFRSNKRELRGQPNSLSDVLTETNPSDRIYYYSDLDLSGTFEPSERLRSDGIQPNDIIWLYSDSDFKQTAYGEPFIYLSNYESTEMVFVEVARFIRGPLSPRKLYVVAIRAEKE